MASTLKILASVLERLAAVVKGKPQRLPPHHLLPTELWETVFDELSGPELLRAATICATFNVLCIRLVLRRSNPAMDSASELLFSLPFITLQSSLLTAIHLSFRAFQVKALVCFFGPVGIGRDLRLLGDMILCSTALQVLDMYPSLLSRKKLTSSLCSTIASMAIRVTGPVVIFSHY
ncbi:hypothetical protein DFH06DRAFT_1409431 [Mycena polygramma]|nr:hypothetical protein DFH06DRAFT_1409431 [Mycena polygramma]